MEGELLFLILLIIGNIVIIVLLLLLVRFMRDSAREMKEKLVEDGRPDVSKVYSREFLKVTEQAVNVLEKMKAKADKVNVVESRFTIHARFNTNMFDQFRIFCEIIKEDVANTQVNLDIRTMEGVKINMWTKKLDRFRREFFELLDNETVYTRKFEQAYNDYLMQVKSGVIDQELKHMKGKWGPSGIMESFMFYSMTFIEVGIVVFFGLLYAGVVFIEGAMPAIVMVLVIFTLFWFLGLYDFLRSRNGRMRVVGNVIPRRKVKVLSMVLNILESLNIIYTVRKHEGYPFRGYYICRDHKFSIRVLPFYLEGVKIIIGPVTDENEVVINRITRELDDRFEKEDYSFLEFRKRGRSKST